MTKLAFEYAVYDRLRGKPYLEPIFNDVYGVSRLIQEYDPQMFLVWDVRRKKYEIHSLGNQGSTYGCDVPNNRLDSRVLQEIRKGDLRIRGDKIFKEIEERNDFIERSIERQRRDDIKAAAVEMKSAFAKVAWEGV